MVAGGPKVERRRGCLWGGGLGRQGGNSGRGGCEGRVDRAGMLGVGWRGAQSRRDEGGRGARPPGRGHGSVPQACCCSCGGSGCGGGAAVGHTAVPCESLRNQDPESRREAVRGWAAQQQTTISLKGDLTGQPCRPGGRAGRSPMQGQTRGGDDGRGVLAGRRGRQPSAKQHDGPARETTTLRATGPSCKGCRWRRRLFSFFRSVSRLGCM